jgi:CBS domain containing-hemolysin-like protein
MSFLSLPATIALTVPALVCQAVGTTLGRALRTYSRSRLEEVCAQIQRPERVDQIERDCDWTERSAEAISLVGGFILAALVGGCFMGGQGGAAERAAGWVILLLTVFNQVISGAVGRVWAETLLANTWPIAEPLRWVASPLTFITIVAEGVAQRLGGALDAPRPTSVEVEIPADADHPEADETDLPESTRDMLERVVELSRLDLREIMTPRSLMISLSAEIGAEEAGNLFGQTGFSRIPIYGESRDDIVGILYAKDLFPALLHAEDRASVLVRRLARPPYFVPESKNAGVLLEEFRDQKLQIAVVLDEYGAVVGLVTFEDLIEQLVGPVTDEHDLPENPDDVVALSESSYEVDATVPIEVINERLKLQLPTQDDIYTVGGLAFHHLGRLPEPGAYFDTNGVGVTVTEVADHSIRRVRLERIAR